MTNADGSRARRTLAELVPLAVPMGASYIPSITVHDHVDHCSCVLYSPTASPVISCDACPPRIKRYCVHSRPLRVRVSSTFLLCIRGPLTSALDLFRFPFSCHFTDALALQDQLPAAQHSMVCCRLGVQVEKSSRSFSYRWDLGHPNCHARLNCTTRKRSKCSLNNGREMIMRDPRSTMCKMEHSDPVVNMARVASAPPNLICHLSQDRILKRTPSMCICVAIRGHCSKPGEIKWPYVGELSGAGWSGVDRISLRRRASSPAKCLRKEMG